MGAPRRNDLAIRLKCHSVKIILGVGSEIGRNLTVLAECVIEPSIRKIACQGKIKIVSIVRYARSDDLAVWLNGHCQGLVDKPIEIGVKLPAVVKCLIKRAIRQVSGQRIIIAANSIR